MAGNPRHIIRDPKIDSKYLSYINNLSSGNNTTNVTSSHETIKQYVKSKNGIFSGAFGSIGSSLAISSGRLDLTANTTGAIPIRRMVYVLPESGTSDTLDNIEMTGLELPYQELTLISSTNNTITITHNGSAGGTSKNIYCPGDTDYVLEPNEAIKLIYDPINTLWLVTGNASNTGADNLGNHTATQSLNMADNQIQRVTTLFLNGDTNNAHSIAGDTGGLNYNVDNTDETHDIKINGVTKFSVGNSGLYASTDISMQGNVIYLDSDIDTYLHSTSDDSIQIATGGSVRISIGNTSTIINSVLSVLGNSILGDSAGDSITLNGLVNFANNYSAVAQTASDSTGYITVLIGGSAKKLYYY